MEDKCPHCDIKLASRSDYTRCDNSCPIKYEKTQYSEYFTISDYIIIIHLKYNDIATIRTKKSFVGLSPDGSHKIMTNPFKNMKDIQSLKDTLNLILTFQ